MVAGECTKNNEIAISESESRVSFHNNDVDVIR